MIEQGSPEWHQARLGRVTASRINDVMMGKDKAGYQNYRAQLVCERLTGMQTETFKSAAMQQGNDVEPQARAVYSLATGQTVEEVGFVEHPSLASCGASPDGHVGDEGMVQIKCPEPKTHIKFLMGGAVPRLYAYQMQWEMACAGRKWNDFVSFNADLPDEMRLFIQKHPRNDTLISEMERASVVFLAEVDAMCSELTSKYVEAAQ